MLLLFQLIFTAFALYAIVGVVLRKKDQLLGPKGLIFWILFWIAGLVIVWQPNITNTVAGLFGIGRGTDFILYISIAALFFLLFRLHIKIESVGRDVTNLTRIIALKNKDRS